MINEYLQSAFNHIRGKHKTCKICKAIELEMPVIIFKINLKVHVNIKAKLEREEVTESV